MELVSNINFLLGILTVASQITIALIIAMLVFQKEKLDSLLKKYALPISFAIALAAASGSLFYSEIAGYDPCKLCWFQRIFMYPQTILLGIALWKKDYKIALYSLILSLMGAAIAGYHYLLQIGIATALPCSAVGYSASCSQRFVMQFGYITIPMMAFTGFILIALLMGLYLIRTLMPQLGLKPRLSAQDNSRK